MESNLTENQVLALEHKERVLYGEGGDVRQRLPQLNEETNQETYRQLLPGLRAAVSWSEPRRCSTCILRADPETTFSLMPNRPRAVDPLLSSLERYAEGARELLTVYKPTSREDAVWMHPGEPVFDCLSDAILERFGRAGRQGAVFTDPYATEAYLFHIARVSVEQRGKEETTDLFDDRTERENAPKPIESRLVGLRQSSDGSLAELPVEHLLLLRGADGFAPSRVPLATLARGMVADALGFARGEIGEQMAQLHRQGRFDDLPSHVPRKSTAATIFRLPNLRQPARASTNGSRDGDRDRRGGTRGGQESPAPPDRLPKSTPRRTASRTGVHSGG